MRNIVYIVKYCKNLIILEQESFLFFFTVKFDKSSKCKSRKYLYADHGFSKTTAFRENENWYTPSAEKSKMGNVKKEQKQKCAFLRRSGKCVLRWIRSLLQRVCVFWNFNFNFIKRTIRHLSRGKVARNRYIYIFIDNKIFFVNNWY